MAEEKKWKFAVMKSRFNVTYCARKHFALISQLRNQNAIQSLKAQIHDGIGVSINQDDVTWKPVKVRCLL